MKFSFLALQIFFKFPKSDFTPDASTHLKLDLYDKSPYWEKRPSKRVFYPMFLTLFRMGFFWSCSWMKEGGGGLFSLPSLKSATHILQWWNLAQLYLTSVRSQKSINHVTHPLSSADISIFSLEISKFCYIKKYRYRLDRLD